MRESFFVFFSYTLLFHPRLDALHYFMQERKALLAVC